MFVYYLEFIEKLVKGHFESLEIDYDKNTAPFSLSEVEL
jgi:hypothetical protein